jgi:hypothetical protein
LHDDEVTAAGASSSFRDLYASPPERKTLALFRVCDIVPCKSSRRLLSAFQLVAATTFNASLTKPSSTIPLIGFTRGYRKTMAALTLDRRARSHPDLIMTPVRTAAPEFRPQRGSSGRGALVRGTATCLLLLSLLVTKLVLNIPWPDHFVICPSRTTQS